MSETGPFDSKKTSFMLVEFTVILLKDPVRDVINYSMRVAIINIGFAPTCRDVAIVSSMEDSGTNPTLDNI
jgi:uncharacterized membrane protein